QHFCTTGFSNNYCFHCCLAFQHVLLPTIVSRKEVETERENHTLPSRVLSFAILVIRVICGFIFMRTLVIINNVAARARRAWPIIEKQLAMSGIEYEAYKTRGPADATTQTRRALKAGTKNIAVVGGDGTLSEAAEGFFDFHKDREAP